MDIRLKKSNAVRIAKVCDQTGISRTQIYRLIKSGDFPRPVKLSTRIVAWNEDTISDWLDQKFQGG